MIRIAIPNNNLNEREYTIGVLLYELLGINYKIELGSQDYELILENDNRLIVEDHFFGKYPKNLEYLKFQNIPQKVFFVSNQFTPEQDVPIIYGTSRLTTTNHQPITINCGIDIFASSFFMLTRWEEIASNTRDIHNRFPASASLAYKCKFLSRPIVNEYLEMLWRMLKYLDDSIKRKRIAKNIIVSCDVDRPLDPSVISLKTLFKACSGDIIKRKSPFELFKRVNRFSFNKLGYFWFDPYYTFEWYMNTCEKYGRKASFYFIADASEPINGYYKLTDRVIINLLRLIDLRGHEIGVHGSYQTYMDREKTIKQKKIFETILQMNGIKQNIKGNRQHYLLWDIAFTPEILNDAGFEYDTTGSYADIPGFRYGTSYEFSMWGWCAKKKLMLKQRPLIVMEASVVSSLYMGYGYTNETYKVIYDLKCKALKYGGNFTLLWHNSSLKDTQAKEIFKRIIHD